MRNYPNPKQSLSALGYYGSKRIRIIYIQIARNERTIHQFSPVNSDHLASRGQSR